MWNESQQGKEEEEEEGLTRVQPSSQRCHVNTTPGCVCGGVYAHACVCASKGLSGRLWCAQERRWELRDIDWLLGFMGCG